MDVINVVSVTSEAKVKQWFEDNDADIQDGAYWRQGFLYNSSRLSVCSSKPRVRKNSADFSKNLVHPNHLQLWSASQPRQGPRAVPELRMWLLAS